MRRGGYALWPARAGSAIPVRNSTDEPGDAVVVAAKLWEAHERVCPRCRYGQGLPDPAQLLLAKPQAGNRWLGRRRRPAGLDAAEARLVDLALARLQTEPAPELRDA